MRVSNKLLTKMTDELGSSAKSQYKLNQNEYGYALTANGVDGNDIDLTGRLKSREMYHYLCGALDFVGYL